MVEFKANPWQYSGDVNLTSGGVFVKADLSDFHYGYAECVEVTDLDSACGAGGLNLIEKGTVNLGFRRVREAIKSAGRFDRHFRKADKIRRRCMIVEAVKAHWGMDVGASETVRTDSTYPMRADGWRAVKHIEPDDLPGYVLAKYLD